MEGARGEEDRCERKDGRHRVCGSACGSWGRVIWRRSLIVKAEGDCIMATGYQLSWSAIESRDDDGETLAVEAFGVGKI